MKRTETAICLATLVSLAPAAVHGLGIRIADQNAFATARGNAFAATADDASAVYYNPAGLAQLEGQQILLGSYAVSLGSEYTAPNGAETRTKGSVQFTPQLFYALKPKDCPVSFGLGFYTPYGLGLEWPDNSTFRAMKGSITYLTLNPSAAWKLHPTLSVGAGLTLNHGEAELTQTILPSLFRLGGDNQFKGDGDDIGFNVGALWQPAEKHSFGATYYSATRLNLKGTSTTYGVAAPPIPSSSESANARFQFPQHAVVGYSFRPTPNWNLEANVDWTDWDSLDTVTIQKASGPAGLPFNWKSSFFYEFGLTRYFSNGLRLSGGYIYSENSVPDANFNPLVPDSDRHIFSVGLGGKYKKFHWDAAYQAAYGPDRAVSNNTLVFPLGGSANGNYQFVSHALALTGGYSF